MITIDVDDVETEIVIIRTHFEYTYTARQVGSALLIFYELVTKIFQHEISVRY